MADVYAGSALIPDICLAVINPPWGGSKTTFDKLRHIFNMRYGKGHLVTRVLKFEGLSEISDMAEKDDYSVCYDLILINYHVSIHPDSQRFMRFKWQHKYYQYICLPFGLSTTP